jgi:predicted signal transduction protein with EAL and GGDEF domain
VDQGCTLGQGYLFSRPVPAEEIASRFQRKPLRLVTEPESGEIRDASSG